MCVGAQVLSQWRMQDSLKGGSSIIMRAKRAKISKPRPLFNKPRPFSIVLERNFLLYHVNRPVFDRDFC